MRLPPPAGRSPRRSFRRGGWLLGLGLAALAGGTAVAAERAALPANSPRRNPIVDVVERVRDCVVNIHSERNVAAPAAEELFTLAPSPSRVNGMGSGVIIDPRGYIVINQHVVDDVQVLRVRLSDGSTYGARVVAREPEADLALLKIEANRPLPTPVIGKQRLLGFALGAPAAPAGTVFYRETALGPAVTPPRAASSTRPRDSRCT